MLKPDDSTYLLFRWLLTSRSMTQMSKDGDLLHKINTLVVGLSLVMTSENNLSSAQSCEKMSRSTGLSCQCVLQFFPFHTSPNPVQLVHKWSPSHLWSEIYLHRRHVLIPGAGSSVNWSASCPRIWHECLATVDSGVSSQVLQVQNSFKCVSPNSRKLPRFIQTMTA